MVVGDEEIVSDSNSRLVTTILGGTQTVGSGFGVAIEEGASDSNVEEVDYDRLFDDLEGYLSISNSFGAKILNSERKFVVPSYQRYYSWGEPNHEELWRSVVNTLNELSQLSEGTDLASAAEQHESTLNESYFGPVYIAESTQQTNDGPKDIFEVIDGQQRLATLFLILNEIRKKIKTIETELGRKERASDEFEAPYRDGIEYLRKGIISSIIYNNGINDGKSKFLQLDLNTHDKRYFQINFEDNNEKIIKILDGIDSGKPPYWKKVRTILKDASIEPDDLNINIDDIDATINSDYPSLSDFLDQKLYFATKGSHSRIFTARQTYDRLLEQYLSENLDLSDDDYKQRAVALINIAIVVMTSFRIVEFKFDNSVDNSMKIDVFQSLNETGKPLTLTEKIRARVVNKFGIGDESAEEFEELVQFFGEDSDTIQQYLVDYILATETEKVYKKENVKNNLLRFFSLREETISDITSRLTQGDPGEFIDNLREHAEKYKRIKGQEKIPSDDIPNQEIRNECNNIIADLPGKQWRPFALRLYIDLKQSSSFVSGQFFRDMLRNIESIMIRNSFATSAATAIDKTFIGACRDYNNNVVPDYDEIDVYDNQDEDWMDVEEFNEEPRKIIEAHFIRHSTWDTISGTSVVRNMHGSAWSNNKEVLHLLARRNMASQPSAPGAVSTKYTLDLTSTEIEHILPQTPEISADDRRSPDTVANPLEWYNVFFKLHSEDTSENWPSIADKFEDIEETSDADEAEYERLRDLCDHIIEDVGNQIILEQKPNQALRNTLFSTKGLGYYLTRKTDLDVFGDPFADPGWLHLSIEELAQDAECLGLKLGEGEASILLYQLEKVFEAADLSEVNAVTSTVDLEDTNKLNNDEFGSSYDVVEDLLSTFGLSEEDYGEFHDNYAYYEFDSEEDELVNPANNEDSLHPAELYDQLIITILTKIVSHFDVTEPIADPNEECTFETDYIVSRVNEKWNWERVVDRKIKIIQNLLDEISMSTVSDEFSDLDYDFHYNNVLNEFKFR